MHDVDTRPVVEAVKRSAFVRLLAAFATVIPGDYLRTTFYLYCVSKPRKLFRLLLSSFYRMDHVYEVLEEFRGRYTGSFSILEFGVADGYSYTKKLYATKYLGMADRVLVHGFDSFEGMPSTSDERDRDMVADDSWVEGQYKGRYEALDEYCRAHYSNYRLHRGVFDETVNEVFLASLEEHPPILIWIDCDYYTSARAALEPLIPYIFQAGAWCTSTTSS